MGDAQTIALNGANCGKVAIDQIRELDPNSKTNPRTKAVEDCVFTNLGGGFASGGSLGGAIGSFGGPVGGVIGAALGASAGSIGGAVAYALDYCCNRYGCQRNNFNQG